MMYKQKALNMAIVYKLTAPNGKFYIGETKRTLMVRWKEHCNYALLCLKRNNYRGKCTKLYYALNKYPHEEWKQEVLREFETSNEALAAERQIIKETDAIANGYNIHEGGDPGNQMGRASDEHCKHISEGRTAWFKTPDGTAWKKELRKYWKGNTNGDQNIGRRHYHDPNTGQHIFVRADESVSTDFVLGFKHSDEAQKPERHGWFWCKNLETHEHQFLPPEATMPSGFVRGNFQSKKPSVSVWRITYNDGSIKEGFGQDSFAPLPPTTMNNHLRSGKPIPKYNIAKVERSKIKGDHPFVG